MLVKLKEKSVQYKIAIYVFIIMFVLNILAQSFLEIKHREIYVSVVEFILNFSACFIFALLFRDVFYKNKYENIINSEKFIKMKNRIFITTLVVCIVYLVAIEFNRHDNISIIQGFGIVVAGSASQQLNLEIRKNSKIWKKILVCCFYILFSILFLCGSFLELQ